MGALTTRRISMISERSFITGFIELEANMFPVYQQYLAFDPERSFVVFSQDDWKTTH